MSGIGPSFQEQKVLFTYDSSSTLVGFYLSRILDTGLLLLMEVFFILVLIVAQVEERLVHLTEGHWIDPCD